MKLDVDYFIKKFESIPESKWTVGSYNDGDKHCALGHCNIFSEEADSLQIILNNDTTRINDNTAYSMFRYGNTPKTRILNALREIKDKK